MVQAWRFNPTDDDQRNPHQFSPNVPVSLEELAKIGVFYHTIDVTKEDYIEKVDAFAAERKYKNRDVINIRKDTLPNYEEKLKTFFEEHLHEDEEIRFILAGAGYFDVRDKNDEWIRIATVPSDLIVLPAGIYHRFTLDNTNYIQAMRLFKEDPKWTPINRSLPTTDSNHYRVEYATWLAAQA
ncbi:1,2-dihydroxy-3-keto-5-methylthiopentene dioxygenase 3 [Zopfochytrium polystomum]|nr:1,2-dihydroxy-3-keto-5-methylthiopentene dioxygenase 3 [Zopfochytrium polystomum]